MPKLPTATFLPDDQTVDAPPGVTLLQVSLAANIPHVQACGGKGRCSTCRIRVIQGLENISTPSSAEKDMAGRLGFDSAIRLACQCKITGQVTLRRLVLDDQDVTLTSQLKAAEIPVPTPCPVIKETDLAILFSDLRGFTSFAERLLPYDVIHVLNRHFLVMGKIIDDHGGWIDNTMGDGLLALFPGDSSNHACEQAVAAAKAMIEANRKGCDYLERLFQDSLDIGVGIHFGTVVRGELGFGRGRRLTVIGDAVNLASRIESANKEAGTRLLVSQQVHDLVMEHSNHAPSIGKTLKLRLKGKSGHFTLHEVV